MNWILVDEIIRHALMEDLGHGDITTELTPGSDRVVSADFLAKGKGVICGADVAIRCFTTLDENCQADFKIKDGQEVEPGAIIGRITGKAATILSAERVALNFMQRLSGIATQAKVMSDRAKLFGIRVVDTRKTTPGLRTLEKYAVVTGGAYNHRRDLDHAVMLKDNHFALYGGKPDELVTLVKSKISHTMKIVAEAGSPGMVEPIVSAGADIILLDNFTPQQVKDAVKVINKRCVIELSGGINNRNLSDFLIEGVDVISVGALTHSYYALDISLDIKT